MKSWEASTSWSETDIQLFEQLPLLIEYLNLATLDPASLHDDIHPAPVSSTPAPPPPIKKGGKVKVEAPPVPSAEDVALTEERSARYRIGGFSGLAYLIPALIKANVQPPVELLELLRRPVLWSALSSEKVEDSLNMGYEQPGVRRAAYALLTVLLDSMPDEVASSEMLETLPEAVLGNCWAEKDSGVWQAAGPAVVRFLTRESRFMLDRSFMLPPRSHLRMTGLCKGHRQAWQIVADKLDNETEQPEEENEDDDDDKDGEEEEGETEGDTAAPSRAESTAGDDAPAGSAVSVKLAKPFADFLAFISTICPQIPYLTYPLLTLIISSIPDTILPLSPSPSVQLETLFANLWAPVDARLLSVHSAPNQPSAFQAFYSEMLEVITFLVGKAQKQEATETVTWLVKEQLASRAWVEGVLDGKTRARNGKEADAEAYGKALSKVADLLPQGDALEEAVKAMQGAISERAFEEDGQSKGAMALSTRILPVLDGVKAGAQNETVLSAVDGIVTVIAERAVQCLTKAVQSGHAAAAVLGNVVEALARRDVGEVNKVSCRDGTPRCHCEEPFV